MTRTDLGALITRTQAALETAGPFDRAALQLQLDDMNHEYAQRAWLEEDTTNWPSEVVAGAVDEPARAIERPAKM